MKSNQEILQQAVDTWGPDVQIDICIEECAELIQAISKLKRHRTLETVNHVCEEIGDVEIMLEQMRLMFPVDVIDESKGTKYIKIQKRLEKYEDRR